ncbi:MAG TPA: hypothetical protein VG028_17605 [Terriglobia bacterium]|nr:hypothetical protein [Terriglobia bacterium]
MMGRNQLMAIAVLGVWIGITLFMWFAAGRSFATVEQVLLSQNPQYLKITKSLSTTETRQLLRNLASEINRTFFTAYGWAQVILGIALLFLLLRQTPRDPTALAITGAMLAIVLILTLVVTPQIVTLGRSIDFVPRNPPPPQMARFGLLHGAYTGLDGLKLLASLGLLIRWMMRG